MKRLVRASTYDEEAMWTPFSAGSYCVSSEYGGVKYTNSPRIAIRYWYQMQLKDPMDVSISCQTRDDAIKLCKAATDDYIFQLDEKYGKGPHESGYRDTGCPYLPQWIVDEAAKQVSDGLSEFHEGEYGDAVHPFTVG